MTRLIPSYGAHNPNRRPLETFLFPMITLPLLPGRLRWNRSGQRLAQFELSLSAGSNYSFSEANGMFWLERSGTRYGFTLPAP